MDALATVTYAGTKKNLVESEMVADQPAINGNKVTVVLERGSPQSLPVLLVTFLHRSVGAHRTVFFLGRQPSILRQPQ